MAKPPLENLPDDFFGLLAFLRDPTAVEARAQHLQELIDQHNQSVLDLAGAEDINSTRNQARQDRAQAAKELAEAREQVAKLVADTKAGIKAQQDELTTDRRGLEELRTAFHVRESDFARIHAERDAELRRRASELSAREQAATALQQRATTLKDEYEQRRAKLEAALG